MFHTPGNMVTGPKWRAALYLDERASPEQADALEQIFSGRAGGFWANIAPLIGDQLGVRQVPINFELGGIVETRGLGATLGWLDQLQEGDADVGAIGNPR